MNMDAVDYFKEYDFAESSVNKIRYQPELDQLEIVLSYSGFVPALARPPDDPTFQQPEDFRRLVFSSVTQLRRSRCRYKTGFRGFDPADFNYRVSQPFPGHLEIEAAYVKKIVDARRTIARYKAEIHIGSFGTYGFEFGSLSAFQRLVKLAFLPTLNADDPFSDAPSSDG